MKHEAHDIRLAAALELASPAAGQKTLSRPQAEALADALAADLARTVPAVDQSMLVLGGGLFETADLLRPGLPAWSALMDLARPSLRDQGVQPQLLAIGSHQGRMPDQRLSPSAESADNRFLIVPLLLLCPADQGSLLEKSLESELFERGSIDPPARALLHDTLGLDTVHGQLLTATDLLALQHVQMDAAGLGPFWPVVEHAILRPDEDSDFSIAAGLEARWQPGEQEILIRFQTFDELAQPPAGYALWQRSFRTLTALLDSHGMKWRVACGPAVRLAEHGRLAIHLAGNWQGDGAAVTEQHDPDTGLIAWTVATDGQLTHYYPLDAGTAQLQKQALIQRHGRIERPELLQFCPESFRLLPVRRA